MLKEFKEFIFTGNVIDFAIAVILAGAVGLVVSGTDFSNMMVPLGDAVDADGNPANAIKYGKWINAIINLLIVGWVLFMLGKAKIKFMGAAPDPDPTLDQNLLTEIRDSLKK